MGSATSIHRSTHDSPRKVSFFPFPSIACSFNCFDVGSDLVGTEDNLLYKSYIDFSRKVLNRPINGSYMGKGASACRVRLRAVATIVGEAKIPSQKAMRLAVSY